MATVEERDAPDPVQQATLGPWARQIYAESCGLFAELARCKASPAHVADELRALKERLLYARKFEILDAKNPPYVVAKRGYHEVGVLQGPDDMGSCVSALPDGRFVSGGEKGTLYVWSRRGDDGWEYKEIGRHRATVHTLHALPDGTLLSGSADGTIALWYEVDCLEWRCTTLGRHGRPISSYVHSRSSLLSHRPMAPVSPEPEMTRPSTSA